MICYLSIYTNRTFLFYTCSKAFTGNVKIEQQIILTDTLNQMYKL